MIFFHVMCIVGLTYESSCAVCRTFYYSNYYFKSLYYSITNKKNYQSINHCHKCQWLFPILAV